MPRWLIHSIVTILILIFVFYQATIQDEKVIDLPYFKIRIAYTKITFIEKKSPYLSLTQQYDINFYNNTTPTNNTYNIIANKGISVISRKKSDKDLFEGKIHEPKHLEPILIKKTNWLINLTFDNDIFDNSDYYYTNGIRLDIIAPFLKTSPINKILIRTKSPDIELSGFSFVQNIYTPTNPDTLAILYGDHPFSAYLTIGQFRETYDLIRKLNIESKLSIGVIGPSAFGGQVQSNLHETDPLGWQNQINNDIILDYSVKITKGVISHPLFEINAITRGSLGTLVNKIGGGYYMRFGQFLPFYQGPSSIFENKNPGGRYQFWLFSKAIIDWVAYDATLQGGLFNSNNPYVLAGSDVNNVVLQASIGFALYYNSIGIEYEHFYQNPRFLGANHFGWGSLKAVIAF